MRGEIKSILVFQEIGYDYQNLWQQIEAKGVLSRQTIVSEVKEYEQALILQVFDLIVSFHNPPRIEAQKALELKNLFFPETPMICIINEIDEDVINALFKESATDVVLLSSYGLLPHIVERAINRGRINNRNTHDFQALHESEKKHRQLFETMSLGVIYQEAGGRIISANPAAEKILGITARQMMGMTSMDSRWKMITEDGIDIDGAEHPAMIALKTGEKVGPVIRGVYIPEKNDYAWLSITAIPLFRNNEALPYQAYATFEDITLSKKNEVAVLEHRQLLETVINNLPVAINVLSSDEFRIELANPAYRAIAPGKEMIGLTWEELWPETGREFAPICKRVLETGESFKVVNQHNTIRRTPDGPIEDAYFSWVLHKIKLPGRKGWGLLGSTWETTELVKANIRLAKVLEAESIGVMFWNTETGVLTDANEAFLNMTGYSRADIEDQNFTWQKFTPEEYYEISQSEMEKFKSVGRVGPYEKEYYCKNGSRKWFLFAGSSLGNNECVEFCIDISDRKIIEKELEQKQILISEMGKAACVGGWEFDVQTGKGTWTDETARIHDIDPKEETNVEKGISFYKPDSRVILEQAIKKAIEYKVPYDLELEIVTAKGVEKWVQSIGNPVVANGKVVKLRGSFQDITVRKKAEFSLSQSEARYRSLFENMNAGFVLFEVEKDCEGKPVDLIIKAANECFERTTGLVLKNVLGRKLSDALPGIENDAADWIKTYAEVAITGRHLQFEQCSELLDNWFSISAFQITENQCAVTFVDITERKKTEAKLVESEARFRKIYEDGANGMVMAGPDFKFIMANRTFCQMTGYDESELLNMTFIDITYPDDRVVDMPNIKKMMSGELEVYRTEKRYLKKDGSVFWAQLTVSPIFDSNRQLIYFVGIVGDITERKLAEIELLRLARIMKNSQEIAQLGSFEYVDASQTAIWSEGQYRIYGLDPSNPSPSYNDWLEKFIHPEDKEMVNDLIDIAKTKNEGYELEYRINRPNGEVRWVVEKAHPYYDQNNKLAGYVGATIDITGRKQSVLELQNSEEKFRSLFQNHTAAKLIIDVESGRIADANSAAAKLYGWSVDELQNLYFSQISKASYEWILRNSGTDKEAEFGKMEFRHSKSDGSTFDVEVFISFIRLNEKRFVHVIVFDITDKKQAEKNIQLLKGAIEAASVAVFITNASGEIYYANAFFSQLTEYSPEEILGRKPDVIKSGNQSENFYRDLWATVHSGKTWEGELVNKKKNGELYWVRAIISPILDPNGDVVNIVAIQEDISLKKQAEETHKQLEFAKKTARFKQDFLAKMSHEIRTPLSGVLGMIEVLEQTDLKQEQKEYVKDIKSSGENLKEIINQVLEYSKIEAGKISLRPQDFEFMSLLEEARSLYKDCLSANVAFLIEVDSHIPQFICADKIRLSQVVNNFVSNAIKFTREGSITLKATFINKEESEGGITIKNEVCDTGKGIPNDLQRKLFNPFIQSEEGERLEYEGTGLGLSISSELVTLMHGAIGVESELGKGSVFWFTFLAKPAAFKPPEILKEIPHVSARSIKILLVEDALVLQKIVRLMLTSMGHEVTIANNGQQALELFEPGKFDLILMDVNMPIMDGVTATRLLKEKYMDLPLIVGLSANAFEGDRERFLAQGMDDYLTKPFSRADFERLLPQILKS